MSRKFHSFVKSKKMTTRKREKKFDPESLTPPPRNVIDSYSNGNGRFQSIFDEFTKPGPVRAKLTSSSHGNFLEATYAVYKNHHNTQGGIRPDFDGITENYTNLYNTSSTTQEDENDEFPLIMSNQSNNKYGNAIMVRYGGESLKNEWESWFVIPFTNLNSSQVIQNQEDFFAIASQFEDRMERDRQMFDDIIEQVMSVTILFVFEKEHFGDNFTLNGIKLSGVANDFFVLDDEEKSVIFKNIFKKRSMEIANAIDMFENKIQDQEDFDEEQFFDDDKEREEIQAMKDIFGIDIESESIEKIPSLDPLFDLSPGKLSRVLINAFRNRIDEMETITKIIDKNKQNLTNYQVDRIIDSIFKGNRLSGLFLQQIADIQERKLRDEKRDVEQRERMEREREKNSGRVVKLKINCELCGKNVKLVHKTLKYGLCSYRCKKPFVHKDQFYHV